MWRNIPEDPVSTPEKMATPGDIPEKTATPGDIPAVDIPMGTPEDGTGEGELRQRFRMSHQKGRGT